MKCNNCGENINHCQKCGARIDNYQDGLSLLLQLILMKKQGIPSDEELLKKTIEINNDVKLTSDAAQLDIFKNLPKDILDKIIQ